MHAGVAEAGGCAGHARSIAGSHTSLCIVGGVTTFRRLLGFLRPYRRPVIGSLVLAWLAMGMTVLIPWLVGQRGQRDRASSDESAILPLALAIVGAGVLRLGLTVVRRLIAGKVSVAVEYDLRERIYGHLQALELGFFDSQQTGQLMSRATVDLQSIRFFLGYGLIFLTQNALTIAARERGHVRARARARGARAAAGAVRGPHGDRATAGARARRCRRSSSGSRSSPPRPRRASPGSGS